MPTQSSRSATAELRRKEKKKKKRKASQTPPPPPSPRPEKVLSPWAARFLTLDRSTIQLQVDEREPMNDSIVESLKDRCVEDGFEPSSESEEEDEVVAVERPRHVKVFVGNLPYLGISESDVADFCGAGVVKVSLSRGVAFVTFVDLEAATQFVEGMGSKDFRGRTIRARIESQQNNKKPTLSRYFTKPDAAVFEKKRNTCSFCAKPGHTMDSCPDSLCDVCLKHHPPGYPSAKCRQHPLLCTACGQWGHSWKWCTDLSDKPEALEKNAICVVCRQIGHVNCKPIQMPKAQHVYCSWCATEGHTEPSCPIRHHRGTQRRRHSDSAVVFNKRKSSSSSRNESYRDDNAILRGDFSEKSSKKKRRRNSDDEKTKKKRRRHSSSPPPPSKKRR